MKLIKQFALLLLVLVELLGCGKNQDTPAAQPSNKPPRVAPSQPPAQSQEKDDSPANVRKHFEQLLGQHVQRITPRLKQKFPGRDGSRLTFSAEYVSVAYDIRRTDSIVSPYLATASYTIRWYCNGEFKATQAIIADYSYTDAVWHLRKARREPDETDWSNRWVQGLFAD